jgi:hypothetical protein
VLGTALGPFLSGLLIDAGVPFSGIVVGLGLYCLVEKRLGETLAPDHDPPSWTWPKR